MKKTALHEAGHAVMSIHLKRGIDYVEIMQDSEGWQGVCRNTPLWNQYQNPELEDPHFDRKLERELLIFLAGYLAKEQDENIDIQSEDSDFQWAMDIAAELCDDEKIAGDYLAELWEKTRTIIHEPLKQKQIEAVADALCKKKRLSGRSIRKIAKEIH